MSKTEPSSKSRVQVWLPAALAIAIFVGGIVFLLVAAATGHAEDVPAKTIAAGSILVAVLLTLVAVLIASRSSRRG
jgi:cation transporter-like permease